MKNFLRQKVTPKFNGTGLIEIAKALLAFTNLITALAIINIVYKQEHPLTYSVWVAFMFVVLYFTAYKLIKKGEEYV